MRFGRADAGIGTPGTVLALYVGSMVALSGAYLIWWPGSSLLFAAIGVFAAGAVLVGVRRYRPDRWRWWLVLAAAPLLDTSARIVYSLLPGPVGTLKPGVWVVWLLHLVMLAALVTGILGLARSALRAVSTVIDIAIIMLGAGLLFGILIAIPYAGEPGIGALWATVRVAYVARDVVMLALLAYIGLAGGRGPSSILVQAGLLGFVVSDVLFRLGRIRGEWLLATPIDAGWLLFAAAVGAAALVPSMVDFAGQGQPGARLPVAERPSAQLRLGLVMVVALVPSIGLVVGLFEPPGWYSKALVFTATAMLLLAFARIVDVTTQLRDKVRGERVIRDAVAALADAQDPPSVTAVIRRAIESLVRPGSVHGVTLSSLSAARRGPGLPPDGHAWTVAIPVGGDVRSPTAGAAARQEEPSLLFVRGNRRALERARSWLSILATQAGVALDRIRLNEDLIRHMREAYATIAKVAREHRVPLRTAAFIVAIGRVGRATVLRGV